MRKLTVCEVHRILDNDLTPRDCIFCSLCNAWICMKDRHRVDRRMRAGLDKQLDRLSMGRPVQPERGKPMTRPDCGCKKK
jgi:hypothetical protein